MINEVFNYLLNVVSFGCRLTKTPNGEIWLREKGSEEATIVIRSSNHSPNDMWSSVNQGKGHLVIIDCVSTPRKDFRSNDPRNCARLALVMFKCILAARKEAA